MKRDLNLIREILLQLESTESSTQLNISVPPNSEEVLLYHCYLLASGGFMQEDQEIRGNYFLTWKAHEFLDLARDQRSWDKAIKRGGDASFAVVKALLTQVAMRAVGL